MTKKTLETTSKKKRDGICYFLLKLLEDESYPHVKWINKEKGEFQIHWMHASSGAWEMNTDAETFRLWAEYKGKLQGRENRYKTWKANFRCAMKSRQELEEIKLPKGAPQKKKNLKYWKFIDTELISRYKEGKTFSRSHQCKSSIWKKAARIRPSKVTKNKIITDTEEKIEIEQSQPSHSHLDCCDQPQSPDTEQGNNSYGTELLEILDRNTENTDSVVPNIPLDERLEEAAEVDNNSGSYGSELLHILEQRDKDKVTTSKSTMPFGDLLPEYQNLNRKENTDFHQFGQLPLIQQIPSPSEKEQHLPEVLILVKDWEVFGSVHLERKLEEDITVGHFKTISKDLTSCDDPFPYDGTPFYTKL